MNSPNVKIQVNLLTDEKFQERPVKDIFANVEVPDAVRGFQRGPRSLSAMACDQRDIVVATAVGHLLEHTGKQPLLYVVQANADAPYQGLEYRVVVALLEYARAMGICGIWLHDNVAAIVKAANSDRSGAIDKPTASSSRWWHRLWRDRKS